MPLMVDVDTHAKADRVDEMDCEFCGGHCFRHPYWRYFYWLHSLECPRWGEAQSAVIIPSADPFKESKPVFDRTMGTWRPPPTQMVQYPIQIIPTPWWESRRKLAYGPRCPLCDSWPLAEHRRDCLFRGGNRLQLLHRHAGLLLMLRQLYAWGPDEPRAEMSEPLGAEYVRRAKRAIELGWKSPLDDDLSDLEAAEALAAAVADLDSSPEPQGSAEPTGRTEYRIACPHCGTGETKTLDPSLKTIGMCCHCEGPSWPIFEGVRPTGSVESPADRVISGAPQAEGTAPEVSAPRLPPGLEPDRLPVQPDGGVDDNDVQRREERSRLAVGHSPRPSADACEWGAGRSGAPEARSGGTVPRSGLDRSHEGPPCRSCGYVPPIHAVWCGRERS